jgi:hypothetical protein
MPFFRARDRLVCIERVDRWVGVQHLSEGGGDDRSLSAFDNPRDAEARVIEEVQRVERDGFALVEASDQPRFVFANGDRTSFVWLRVRGEMLLEANGSAADIETASARPTFVDSEDEARAQCDRRALELVASGYVPVFFGIGSIVQPKLPKRRGKPASPGVPEHLMSPLRENPHDNAAWAALADWIVADDPELGELIALERAGKAIDLRDCSPKLRKRLVGDSKQLVPDSLRRSVWRSAHVIECELSSRRRGGSYVNENDLFATCAHAPMFALLSSLRVEIVGGNSLASLGALAPQLRSLAIEIKEPFHESRIPPGWFHAMPALRALTLDVRDVHLPSEDSFDHIEKLMLGHHWPEELFRFSFANLRVLELDLRRFVSDTALDTVIERIATKAPKLTTLRAVVGAGWLDADQTSRVLGVLERSSLLSRVANVALDSREYLADVAADRRDAWRAGAFAHLERLELAAIYARRHGLTD